MADWNIRAGLKGLAVEGKYEELILPAFLTAGEQNGFWQGWSNQIVIKKADGYHKVLEDISNHPHVWGLIDRDVHTEAEVRDLKRQHPRLLILPRWTLENYFIDPVELELLLPVAQRSPTNLAQLRTMIESEHENWLQNGALWHVMYEQGALRFCQGREVGYPMALLYTPVTNINDIADQLSAWHTQLEPAQVMALYPRKLAAFRQSPQDTYKQYIHGKRFFNAVVIHALNQIFGQQSYDQWLGSLVTGLNQCPQDLAHLFQQILN